MKSLLAAASSVVAVLVLSTAPAGAEPADRGNCVSTSDNGGAAGSRVSSAAGPGFGTAVAGYLGGGTIGTTASDPDCRRH